MSTEPTLKRKRRRPAVVCTECRRRKIACDKKTPCSHCTQYNAICTYYTPELSASTENRSVDENHSEVNSSSVMGLDPAPSQQWPSEALFNNAAAQSAHVNSNGAPSQASVNGASSRRPPPHVSMEDLTRAMVPTFPTDYPSPSITLETNRSNQAEESVESKKPSDFIMPSNTTLNGRLEKTRLIGQSHFLNSVLPFAEISKIRGSGIFDPQSEPYQLLDNCKCLAREIKSKLQTDHIVAQNYRDFVPPRELCDELVQLYLRTSETVFRILHIPSLEQEIKRYWDNPKAASDAFVIKFLLVMAIGTCFYREDENPESSLHGASSQWIYAAQSWLNTPVAKNRLNIGSIQIQCLLMLALQTNTAVGSDLPWLTTGSLIHSAMTIGLHRDPKYFPSMSILQGEIRRRLWATILEITIQASLDGGMPPLISCDDFDSAPPSNIDDDQIGETTTNPPVPHSVTTFSQTSTQCALMRSLPLRLKVTKSLNDLHPDLTYEDTLRDGTKLANACRSNSILFQSFLAEKSAGRKQPTAFEAKLLDLLTRRFLLAIHTPFAHKARENVVYYYSRKICLESSLVLLSYTVPSPPDEAQVQLDDYMHLQIYSRGFFRSVFLHATCTVVAELITELEEASALFASPSSYTPLYKATRASVELALRRVKAGETSVKAYVCLTYGLAHADAILAGTSVDKLTADTSMKALVTCYEILKNRASKIATPPPILMENGGRYEQIQEMVTGDDISEFLRYNPTLDVEGANGWLFSDWDNNGSWF